MKAALVRRVAKLEQMQGAERRKRYVFWNRHSGEPKPIAEPGEELTIYSWMVDDEETAATERNA